MRNMSLSAFAAAVPAVFLLTTISRGNEGLIIDHRCVDLLVIPSQDVEAASALRALMRHASVGTGIIWGLDCFAGDHPTNVSCSGYPAGVYDRSRWLLELRAGNWKSKIDDLVTQVELRADDFDVFMTKFCYIDALGDSHPDWEYFRAAMEQLEADYPGKRFVWWTIPLTRDGQPGTDVFNKLMRDYCTANDKILFDIADIECHEPNGVKLTNVNGDEIISALYTKEIHAGHLNIPGRIRVAGAFWQLMARLAGWTRTITVDDDGPADFDNIQAAIDAASHFDTVQVADGKYSGPGNRDIEFQGKAITVRSANGPHSTIIDCENEGHGVYIVDNDTGRARLRGFTITNTYHGAIKIYSSSPPRMASSGPNGPGYKDVVIGNCIIVDNRDAGILLDGHDNAAIEHCRIAGNGGGGVWSYMSWPSFRNCAVVGNEQTGIRATGATIANCTIAENTGFGLWIYEPAITNSIIWGNGLGGIHDSGKDEAHVTYCCVEGFFKGLGNIGADPCFADPNTGDYHLKSQAGRWNPNTESWVIDAVTSACIDAGNPGSLLADEPNDAANARINMGAYGGTAEASRTPPLWGVLADLTNDGIVAFEDFSFQAADWRKSQSEQPGDLNRDSAVGAADVALLADGWLTGRL